VTNRKIAVFTGNRAEYGLQMPILKAIDAHPQLEYQLIVSGAHLNDEFGLTLKEIEQDGFQVHAKVPLALQEDSLTATALAIGSGVQGIANTLQQLTPDLTLVYADRFESFAAMIASTQMAIPTAHIEGGDITEGGCLDDSVRHAMTKLAHLHFATSKQASELILQLGEEAWRVHTVGLPTNDLIAEKQYASIQEVESRYALKAEKPVIIFTQHSLATQYEMALQQLQPSLDALIALAKQDYQIIIAYPNNDAGGLRIRDALVDLPRVYRDNLQLHASLGRYYYHGILHYISQVSGGACVGNSSSGIKETPAFACPTVNIGNRQSGRLCANNVWHVDYDCDAILQAVQQCLQKDFCQQAALGENPYGRGLAGKRIADVLANVSLDNRLITKRMVRL